MADRQAAARAELARRELARRAAQSTPITENPEQQNTWGQAATNVGQAAAHAATGIGGQALGDVAGLASLMSPVAMAARGLGHTDGIFDPENVRNKVSSGVTYTPENQDTMSMKIVQAPGKVIGGAGEFLRKGADKLDPTGTLGHVAAAVPQAAAAYLGVKGTQLAKGLPIAPGKMGNLSGETVYKSVPSASAVAAAQPKVPTTEELKAASNKAYANAREAGVVVQGKAYDQALSNVRKMVKEEGIDPTLHPKSTAVMKRLDEVEGKDLTLQEAETLRKIALDAEGDLDPVKRTPTPDARIAGKIIDELDDKIMELSALSPARELWSRSRRSQMLDTMIERAEVKAGAHYTQAGMEHALRQEFKQLALNPRRMRGLTKVQKEAIKKVASGGSLENGLRNLGKFDPTSGGMAATTGTVVGAALAGTGNPLGLLVPAAGYVGRRAATRLTKRNVEAAREALVGRGLPSDAAQTKAAPVQSGAPPQGPLAGTGSIAPQARTRPVAEIQADIQRLSERARFALADEPAGSPKVQEFSAELARLQNELATRLIGQ